MAEVIPQSVLRAEGLGKVVTGPLGPLVLLQGVDLDIRQGEAVAVVGVSGSGKSTLLGLLAGLDDVTQGRVYIADSDLTMLDEDARADLRRTRIGFVFQAFHLLANLTALENVMLPLELAGRRDARTVAEQALQRVGLSARSAHYPRQLSGGEQQRVAIARALAPRPLLLFADEPTGNLDQQTGAQIVDLLFEWNRALGTTLVLVTHDDLLAQRCHRVLRLAGGRLQPA